MHRRPITPGALPSGALGTLERARPPAPRGLAATDRPWQRASRRGLAVFFAGLLALSAYGVGAPAGVRCSLPGAVGCPGGWLGPVAPDANSSHEQFFNVSMYDYGFWIVNTATGANDSSDWTVYEGWTVHINATSLKANPGVGGTAYHGLGVELNATGRQLVTVNAPVGKWVTGQFTAPSTAYTHQHIWCTISCGPGHGGMEAFVLNIVPATSIPSVTASATPTSGAAPLPVALSARVTGGTAPYTVSWNYGDGSAAGTLLNESHTYSLSGSYSATVTVTDAKSYTASASVAISVTSATSLTVSVQVSPTSGSAPTLATLVATPSGGSTPYRYAWDLGDGSTGATASLSHLYTAPGVYGPAVTVTDASGARATASATLSVAAATGTFPVTVTATPASGAAPLSVALSETAGGGTAPYRATWVFGDASYGSGASTTHTYSVNGAYEVTVYVVDAAGHVGENTTSVTVSGASGAQLAAYLLEDPSIGAPPLPITAEVSVEGGTAPYATPSWTFGDGASGSGSVVAHTYAALGVYNVTVQVTDANGASATALATVRVTGLELTLLLNETVGDAPLPVSGAASIVGGTGPYGPVSWTWGDGSVTTGALSNHTYAANVSGPVVVRASVSDALGAQANATARLVLDPPPLATVLSNYRTTELPPVDVAFTLNVTGGSGVYATSPLWGFGDGTTTRGPSPQNHTYTKAGHYLVTVATNDSFGRAVNQSLWVNVSGGAATSGGGGPIGSGWSFTGVSDPDTAALELMGTVALSGLLLMLRVQLRRRKAALGRVAPATTAGAARTAPAPSSPQDAPASPKGRP